ncbi:MAG: sensor histidine kinase KdpD, partial [Hyphomicrobiaceae bacterium]
RTYCPRPRRARYRRRQALSSIRAWDGTGIGPGEGEDSMSEAAEAVLRSFVEQAAIALERTALVEQAAKAETAAESERLRSALLSSLSHDLRTPLSSIIGSVTGLRSLGDQMTAAERGDLLATIEEEATRLSRFVSNLLDMTRLEAGALNLRHEWLDPADAVRGAAARIGKAFPGRSLEVDIEEGLPLARGDAALFEQVLFNLLDNAMKYSEPPGITRIAARAIEAQLVVTVTDQGIGIPADALEKVFEKFFRVAGSDGRAPGTGLGLSIASRVVSAMGGTIHAESPIEGDRGTRMTVRLPLAAAGEHQK